MQVPVRLFGGLTEKIGRSELTVELPADATVADLRAAVAREHPNLAPLLERVSIAVDLEVARDRTPLAGAREVALLPPVAGGADTDGAGGAGGAGGASGAHDAGGAGGPEAPFDVAEVRIVDGVRMLTGLVAPPFDVDAVVTDVTSPDVGGTVVFLGTVRDHAPDLPEVTQLRYSAYPEMADRVLATLATELVHDHPQVRGIALLHAVGGLEVGDHTILIVCTSAHRAAAFDACRDALERVKDQLPVWKQEVAADGTSRWVGLPPT